MSYTTGPWEVDPLDWRVVRRASDKAGIAGCILNARTADSIKYNARLIVTAPEFLEAAQKTVSEWDDHSVSATSIEMLRSIIAKAIWPAP